MNLLPSTWRTWLEDRFGLDKIRDNALNRRVAKTPWYYGDGATLALLLGVLVATGVIMTLTYSPTPDTVYDSVVYITEEQPSGWFIRGLHYWSAGLMVVMLLVHLFRQLLVGGYKFPREGIWLTGVVLFCAVIVMAFVGYLLRWDERSLNAIAVVLHMFARVPLIGDELVLFVQGGEEIGSSTLLRLYAVHVIFVPLLLLGFVAYHIYLIVVHGVTSPAERERPIHTAEEQKKLYKKEADSDETGETFYPDTTAKSGLIAGIVFLIALGLAVFYGPPNLFPEASLTEPARPRAEWWYWWYDALIAVVPHVIAPILVVAFPILVLLMLVALPFLDRSPYRGVRKRPILAVSVVACIIALLALTELRRRAPWEGGPQVSEARLPPVPEGVNLTEETEQGRQLFAEYGCTSCHAIDGVGPGVAVDLAGVDRRLQRDEIRDFILQPPEDIPMPSYRGRLTKEELEHLTEFVHVVQASTAQP